LGTKNHQDSNLGFNFRQNSKKKAIKEKIQNLAANNIVAIVANLCSAAFI